MSNYEAHASPFFFVTCPKHRNGMIELQNGFIGEKTWWCDDCGRPYQLKPSVMKVGTYDEDAIHSQLIDLANEEKL